MILRNLRVICVELSSGPSHHSHPALVGGWRGLCCDLGGSPVVGGATAGGALLGAVLHLAMLVGLFPIGVAALFLWLCPS